MSARLVYSPTALADLEQVWDDVYEASGDVETADAFLEALRAAVRAKAAFPRSGHPVNYYGVFTGFYWVRHRTYLAFYRLRDDRMEVARVLHHRRDCLSVLITEIGRIVGEEGGIPS